MITTLRRRGTPRRRGPQPRDGGMVSAEIASALPALVLVVLAAIWAIGVGSAQIRCADAAREAVRVVARGDDHSLAREVAEAVAPAGATVVISEQDGLVAVEVSVPILAPVPFGDRLPSPTVRATSFAVGETS